MHQTENDSFQLKSFVFGRKVISQIILVFTLSPNIINTTGSTKSANVNHRIPEFQMQRGD